MPYVQNRAVLTSSGDQGLRRLALDIVEDALAAADPAPAVRRTVGLMGPTLRAGERSFDLSSGQRVFVVGAGKATLSMALALEEVLGPAIYRGLISVKTGHEGNLSRIEVISAGHPVPDEGSLEAGRLAVEMLQEVRPGDVVIACFTGGSSALFVSPVEGISLAHKAETNRRLLASGANIIEINNVRKHLSTVKGGRLVRDLPAGTNVITLAVSDVIGDHLDYLTDLSVPDRSSFADARATLDKYGLWEGLPQSVTDHLRAAPAGGETVQADELSHLDRTEILLIKADAACLAAQAAARRRGWRALVLSTEFEGESKDLARHLVAIAKRAQTEGSPIEPPCVLIGGGETTVTLAGGAGRGGPNQEFAVQSALELAGLEGIVALAIDTDGTDGPTELAGGIADGTTQGRAAAAGIDLEKALTNHDVSPALEAIEHQVLTGATGTNVNDLKILVVVPLYQEGV